MNLESLILFGNALTGSIPSTLGNLTNLEQLLDLLDRPHNFRLDRFYSTQSGQPHESGAACISVAPNALTGSIPPSLGSLANLTDLELSGTFDVEGLTGSIPPSLGNLMNLEILNLDHNDLTGSIPPSLGNLTNLEILYLDHNDLTGSIPPSLGSLTNLTLFVAEV